MLCPLSYGGAPKTMIMQETARCYNRAACRCTWRDMGRAFNETKRTELASEVLLARSLWTKFWGLMGRQPLPDGQGLLLRPCTSVHTFFMRFPIDVIFLDKTNKVVKIIPAMKPWRAALGGRGAHSALELNGGSAESAGLEVGDMLAIAES
jgi:uncharacterized membrane protein (UPF0127 family)